MLLIDGARYKLWIPEKEVEEFHPIIREHYKDIFGNKSLFIKGSKLKSETGMGSVPDGFVIELNKKPKWHILEIELSKHSIYDHIVNQIGRFIAGISNTETQQKLIDSIYHYIQANKLLKAEIEEVLGSGEIHKYISDLIRKLPILTIIIEERTKELDEALNLLNYSHIVVTVFQTYIREGAKNVHAHLFGAINPIRDKVVIDATFLSELKQAIDGNNETMYTGGLSRYYLQIDDKYHGVHFEFWRQDEDQLGIELHFERQYFDDNYKLSQSVLKHKKYIEDELGRCLYYESPWLKKNARIYILTEIDSIENAIQIMSKFRSICLPILENLDIK